MITMKNGIETTIDGAGRLVIPRSVREEAGLKPGMRLRVRVAEGVVEIAPAPRRVRLVRRGSLTVAVAAESGPALSARTVRATREAVRRGE